MSNKKISNKSIIRYEADSPKNQDIKENIDNYDISNYRIIDITNEKKEFKRFKKCLYPRIKNKTYRNNNDKNIIKLIKDNNEIIKNNNYDSINQKILSTKLFPKREPRKSQLLLHSNSFDNYFNSNSNYSFNLKSPSKNYQLFEKSFTKNMKNKERKTDLINAINKYKNLILRKSDNRFHSLDNITESKNELQNLGRRIDQINRIKIQNIINFKDLYEIMKKRRKSQDNIHETSNKKTENNSKKILVRKLLREEKYIINDDGKEEILEINQSFLPKNIDINTFNINDDIEENNKIKEKNNNNCYRKIIISDNKIINSNKKNLINLVPKTRSFNSFRHINENNSKIFIKKHPKKLGNFSLSKLIDNSFINKDKLNNFDNENNHDKAFKYNKKLLKVSPIKNSGVKINILKNTNNYININGKNYSPDYRKINLKKKNKIFHSPEPNNNFNNYFIHEIIQKENKKNIKNRMMNNSNSLEENNNVITIYN